MAPPRTRSNQNTSLSIPLFYKVFFLYVEPFFSFLGAVYAGGRPQQYLHLTHASSAPLADVPVGTHVALRQLSNLYLLFTINEALVLRATADRRVWRTLLFGLLIADLGHLYSLIPLGSEVFWNVSRWTEMDWGNVAFVYMGAATRISFLMDVGFSTRSTSRGKPRRLGK
jgi:hypothetical protein